MPAAVSPIAVSLQDRWYQAVKNGQKTVEGRLRGHRLATAAGPGAVIAFRNADREDDPAVAVTVTGVALYPSFRAMLEAEGLPNVLPGVPDLDEGVAVFREFYSAAAEEKDGVVAIRFVLGSAAAPAEPLVRNSTSFPVHAAARLRGLHDSYADLQRRAAAAEAAGERPSAEALAAAGLKYYQFLVRAVMSDPEYGIGLAGNARGLLVYHTMGLGKTLLAVATATALWDVRPPVVVVAKALQKNFAGAVEKFVAMMEPGLAGADLEAAQAAAVRRFRFISLDAYNMAAQVARATSGAEGSGTLSGRLLIVDEAHNLFRAVINSPNEKTNARRLYDMVMEARNLRLLFLTGTPASKDPFELVPCFNMLAGYDLLPTQYEVFYRHYVDRAGRRIQNRSKLANRLLGLVSHASHLLPGAPGAPARGEEAPAPSDRRREAGGFPEEFATRVERVEMSPEQFRQYLLAREKEEAEGRGGEGGGAPRERVAPSAPLSLPGSEAGGGSTYYVKSRGLGNFAPPSELRGRPVAGMPDEAFDAETSPKATRLLANLAESPGPALVYSQFVDVGGLAAIARFLGNAGYTEYVPGPAEKKKGGGGAGDLGLFIRAKAAAAGGDAGPGRGARGGGGTFSVDGRCFYDAEKVRGLMAGRPAEEIETARVAWMLEEPPQWGPERAARDVLDDPAAFPERLARIDGADLSLPLLVVAAPPRGGVDFVIGDGVDRLARAVRDKSPAVRIQRVPPDVLAEAFLFEEEEGGEEIEKGRTAGGSEAEEKGWRYAVISGEVPPEARVRIQDAFNSAANAHGEVIRVLLVSKTGAEGLDLKGIRQIHLFEPYWDKSREDQVKARGIRLGSHDHLPVEEREVQPFLYIAVANRQMFEGMRPSEGEERGPPKRYRLLEETTIDERFHERALAKHEMNKAFRALLREVSLECAVNGYGDCRLCTPTDAPLFHEDPIRDLRLPDPCQPLAEADVAVREIELDGVVYYYRVDAGSLFGVRFYAYDDELKAHAPVDPSSGLFLRLLQLFEQEGQRPP